MLGFFVPWIASVTQYLIGLVDFYLLWVVDVLDYYIPGWKLVVLSPFVITFFILPTLVVIYLYISALMLYVYRRRHAIYEGFHQHNVWAGHKKMIAALWGGHGWIWHGYEIEGIQNIPDDGPAMIVYYHGAIPIDLYYLNANLYIEKNRTLFSVMDNFAFKIPGLSKFFQFWGCFPGPRHRVVEFLRAGELVSVAPGGVREALFSENYSILWGERQGFAKAALEADVPIIPVFTENSREAFDYIKTGKGLFRRLYERTRWPLRPLYGGFPVKMTTHIGRPIHHSKNTTPAELVTRTQQALAELIEQHQRKPGSIFLSCIERFVTKRSTEFEILPMEGCSSSEGSVDSDGDHAEITGQLKHCKNLKTGVRSEEQQRRTAVLSCRCKDCLSEVYNNEINHHCNREVSDAASMPQVMTDTGKTYSSGDVDTNLNRVAEN